MLEFGVSPTLLLVVSLKVRLQGTFGSGQFLVQHLVIRRLTPKPHRIDKATKMAPSSFSSSSYLTNWLYINLCDSGYLIHTSVRGRLLHTRT